MLQSAGSDGSGRRATSAIGALQFSIKSRTICHLISGSQREGCRFVVP
jgi:hypothetical protein